MKPIDELREEHQAVRMTLRVLETLCQRLERPGETVDLQHIGQLLEFFSVFVDKCHHGKEEELLFPSLEAVGVPREGGPIGVMLQEHQMGRDYVRKMSDAVSKLESSEVNARFTSLARGYINLLDQHIHKEDNVLFPLAEERLSELKQSELSRGFERIETERIGVGRHEEFHRMLDHLQEVYLS